MEVAIIKYKDSYPHKKGGFTSLHFFIRYYYHENETHLHLLVSHHSDYNHIDLFYNKIMN